MNEEEPMLGMYMALLDTEEQRNKFEYIYQKYCGFMYHVAKDTLGDHYLAEDAVHETFLDLVRIIDEVRISNDKELMSFLKIITYHQSVDIIRRRRTFDGCDEELDKMMDAKDTDDLETVVFGRMKYEKMLAMISHMDEKYKTPLYLKSQGYKISEIADILKITPNNVKVRLHRARKMLLSELEDTDGEK